MNRPVTLTLLLAAATLDTESLAAQSHPTPWTLDECMEWAADHSHATGIQRARGSIATQNYFEAVGQLLPSLNGEVGGTFQFGRNLDQNTNQYTQNNTFNNSYNLSTRLTIFDGLAAIHRVRLGRLNRIAGRQQLEVVRDEAAYATMEAYFNLLYYNEMAALAREQLEESRRALVQSERMEELGLRGFPDVAEMRAKEAADAYRLTNQQNLATVGLILLKERMNFPIDEALEIAPYGTDTAIEKSAASAGAIYDRALVVLPRAQVAESSVAGSRIELQMARGARYPSLVARAGLGTGFDFAAGDTNPTFASQFNGKRNYWFGATLSIPVFNGFSTHANIRRSRHRLTIATFERDQTLRTLRTDIEQAVADMNGGADQYAQALRQSEAARAAYDVGVRKYAEGMLSALELHTSSNRLLEARAALLNSRLGYLLKKRMVDYYGGIPLIKQTEK